MLLILLSWVYILAVSSIVGISSNKLFKLSILNPVVTTLHGFFIITIITGFCAIWLPINWQFHLFLFVLCIALYFQNKKAVKDYLQLILIQFRSYTLLLKILFSVLVVLILMQCASPPFIIDNESYYIQTIKWLNEYGFVKGLVNLHLFLGQTSGWHILQSAFNFSFLYDRFNDLSGLILLLGNYYAITQLNEYKLKNSTNTLLIGLFPVLNIFFFQFVSAPSPDMAIYVLALIVFHQFIECYHSYSKETFLIVLILSVFMVLIKLTALPLLLLSFVLYKRHFVFSRSATRKVIVIIFIPFILLFIKNIIITGNAFFPLHLSNSFETSWHLPNSIQSYFSIFGKATGYHIPIEGFEAISWSQKFKSWLFATGLHGLFNKVMIGLLIIMPLIIRKFYNKMAFWWLYFIAILSMLLFFLTSPQYRFFFSFIMIFGLMFLNLVTIHKKTLKVVLVFSTILAAIPVFLGTSNQQITNNTHHRVSSEFSTNYIIEPYKNSRYSNDFKKINIENTIINSPLNIDFFWGTGNIPLPALNNKQLEYFETYFKVVPQQFSDNLKEGFYYKTIDK